MCSASTGTGCARCLLHKVKVPLGELTEKLRRYIHDQNARYWQLERRVIGMIAASDVTRRLLAELLEMQATGSGVNYSALARALDGRTGENRFRPSSSLAERRTRSAR